MNKHDLTIPHITGAVFLDVAKAFDTVWVDGLLFKLTALNFPSYLVKTISSYLHNRTSEVSFQTATSTHRGMRAGVAQGGLISSVLFSLYVNHIPVPSRHVELALYADDTAITATSRKLDQIQLYNLPARPQTCCGGGRRPHITAGGTTLPEAKNRAGAEVVKITRLPTPHARGDGRPQTLPVSAAPQEPRTGGTR